MDSIQITEKIKAHEPVEMEAAEYRLFGRQSIENDAKDALIHSDHNTALFALGEIKRLDIKFRDEADVRETQARHEELANNRE